MVTDPFAAGLAEDATTHEPWITGSQSLPPFEAVIDATQAIIPDVAVLGMVYNPSEANAQVVLDSLQAIVDERELTLEVAAIADSSEVAQASEALVGRGIEAFIVPTDTTTVSGMAAMVQIADDNDIAVIGTDANHAIDGAAIGLGTDYRGSGVRGGRDRLRRRQRRGHACRLRCGEHRVARDRRQPGGRRGPRRDDPRGLAQPGRGRRLTAAAPVQQPMTTYLVGRLDRLIRRALEELIRDQDVSVVGYTAMSVLEARPGLSNAELARRSFVTPQGMSQTLATLTEGGLIRRTPATRNRRVQLVELTDRGRQVVEVCARVAGFEGELLASVTARQREELNTILLEIVNRNRTT